MDALDLNQKQVADKSGLSRGLVCQIVGRGKYKSTPSQESLAAIVERAFKTTLGEFYSSIPKRKHAKKPTAKRAAA